MDYEHAIHFRNRRAWRRWLEKNHHKETEAWLLHYKKQSWKTGIQHEEAVEEAICHGWIDSKLRSVDEEKYALKYSPRRKGSVWSEINKKIAMRMIDEGKMKRGGLEKIEEAKRNGKWASAYSSKKQPSIPRDLEQALARNKTAWQNFHGLSNSHQTQNVFWIESAKRKETRRERIKAVVHRSSLRTVKPRSHTK